MASPIVGFHAVSKIYPTASGQERYALREVSFELGAGRVLALVGRSGSGKSTLLHLAAGIDVPSRGRVELLGRDLASLGERERTLLRRREVGLIFQFFHLLSHLSVRDNVALPDWISGPRTPVVEERIDLLLERVGLAGRRSDPVDRLSGGEMQRVAICRALLLRPRLLLADEPTGSLDDANSAVVIDLLLDLARAEGSTLIFATHSRELAARADEIWRLQSGSLERP